MSKAARWTLLALPPLGSAFVVYLAAVVLPSLGEAIGIGGPWSFGVQLIVVGPVALGGPAAFAWMIVDHLCVSRRTAKVGLVAVEIALILLAWQQTWMALDLGWG